MTLQRLSCLVLAVVLGTALTVRWYLDAEEAAQASRAEGSGAVVYQHLPLPMRAEPARFHGGPRAPRWVPKAPGNDSSVSAPPAASMVLRPGTPGTAPTLAGPSSFEPGAGS